MKPLFTNSAEFFIPVPRITIDWSCGLIDFISIRYFIQKPFLPLKSARKIKKWREKRNVSQEELSHRAGLYRTYIEHLETPAILLMLMCFTR